MAHYRAQELADLTDRLLLMASLGERTVRLAMQGLLQRDEVRAREAISLDQEIDSLEMMIDRTAVGLLARAPLASDLRLIIVSMKISAELERVGDEATTIARRALELNREPELPSTRDLPAMAAVALEMLGDSLTSLVHRDAGRARSVIPRDRGVDRLNEELRRELAELMSRQPQTVNRCLGLWTISKSLERIGDHAKNLAEEVVYLCEGSDIRHEALCAPILTP